MNGQWTIKILLSSVTAACAVILGVISAKPAPAMELLTSSLDPSVNSGELCWSSTLEQATEANRHCYQAQSLSNSDHLLFDHLTNQSQPYTLLANALILSQFTGLDANRSHPFNKVYTIADWFASSSKISLTSASQKSKQGSGYIASKSASYAAARDRELPLFSIIGVSFSILGLRYMLKLLVND